MSDAQNRPFKISHSLRVQIWTVLLLTFALAQITRAVDLNSDGMSDVWQRVYGISSVDANADPDGDGFSNETEAGFGSDPFDPKSPSSSDPQPKVVVHDHHVDLSWNSLLSRKYQVEKSIDLFNWDEVVADIEATGPETQISIPLGTIYNDLFANRRPVLQQANQSFGSNEEAEDEAGEPFESGSWGPHTIWWTWTAPSSGFFLFTTFGSDFDTTLAIYRGSTLDSLTLVGSNDDARDGLQSALEIEGILGETYAIQVSGYGSSTGSIILNHPHSASPPSNALQPLLREKKMFFRVRVLPSDSSELQNDSDSDGLKDWEESLLATDPFSSDTDGDGMSDYFEFIYLLDPTLPSDRNGDPDNDSIPNYLEEILNLSPNSGDSNIPILMDIHADHDQDGLSTYDEINIHFTNPLDKDTDGDLLTDAWEINYGLDPLNAGGNQGSFGDYDQDGLSNLDEGIFGTNPAVGDTDGDGASDGQEAGQGSNPNSASDGGNAPDPTEIENITFRVGDPSGSHSERWQMTIQGLDSAIDSRKLKFVSREFGEMDERSFKLRKGARYEITLKHVDTKIKDDDGQPDPDHDWEAQIMNKPSSRVLSDDPESFVIEGQNATWLVDNRDGLLGVVDEGFRTVDKTIGLKATLLPLDIVVRKKGTDSAPGSGLLVAKGDTLEFAINKSMFGESKSFEELISWESRRLKGDGTYTPWALFGEQGRGSSFEFTTTEGGIYQIRIEVEGAHVDYLRQKSAPHIANSKGERNDKLKKGNPDFVGIVTKEIQISLRDKAWANLGSTEWAKVEQIEVGFGVDSRIKFAGSWKCNIFVFMKSNEVGKWVPTKTWNDVVFGVPPVVRRQVPPGANDWYDLNYAIPGWAWKAPTSFPEPGWAAMHQHTSLDVAGGGHIGLLDYDGTWINAGEKNVNKSIHISDKDYQPSNYRSP